MPIDERSEMENNVASFIPMMNDYGLSAADKRAFRAKFEEMRSIPKTTKDQAALERRDRILVQLAEGRELARAHRAESVRKPGDANPIKRSEEMFEDGVLVRDSGGEHFYTHQEVARLKEARKAGVVNDEGQLEHSEIKARVLAQIEDGGPVNMDDVLEAFDVLPGPEMKKLWVQIPRNVRQAILQQSSDAVPVGKAH